MTVRAAALLLLGAILGFAIGRVTVPGEGGRGGERGAAPDVRSPDPAPSDAAPPGGASAAANAEEPDAPRDVVLPSRTCEEGELEILKVDFEGFEGEKTAWIGTTNMQGGFEELSESAGEDGTALFVQAPGIHDVWWLDNDGRRLLESPEWSSEVSWFGRVHAAEPEGVTTRPRRRRPRGRISGRTRNST